MEIEFQLLDCDYVVVNGYPVVRLLGKTEKGETVCAFYENFLPYFYVLPKEGKKDDVISFIETNFSSEIVRVEEVEKFLPIGYQTKKSKMLKVVLKNPSKTPSIREKVKAYENVENIFEADILFKYRFMADKKLYGMRWYRVRGQPIKTTTVKTDKCVKIEEIEEVDKEGNVDLKYLSFDIEVFVKGLPDPEKDPISMISMVFYPAYNGKNSIVLLSKPVKKIDSDIRGFRNEKEMLEEFVRIIESFDPDVITGYNINNFDIPYLNQRLRINRIKRAIGRCSDKPLNSRKIGENNYRNSVFGRIFIDPYLIVKELAGRGFFLGLKNFSLDEVAKYLLGEGKIEITMSKTPELWNGSEEDIKRLVDYCRRDSELALKILLEKGFLEKYVALSRVCGLLLQDTLDSGESAKIENLLLREFNKEDYVLPCKPDAEEIKRREAERKAKGFKGAIVLDPITGLHTNCVVYLDFASMYPSIFISFNICPTTYLKDEIEVDHIKTPFGTKFVTEKVRHGIVPRILKTLLEKRAKTKKEMKMERDPVRKRALNAKQEALKRVANAFYGYTGFLRARTYVLDIANAITSCGRHFITQTKKIVEENTPYKVVYGDTDSVMIETKTDNVEEAMKIGEKLAELINSHFNGILRVKLEGVFKTLLMLTKKRYAGWAFEMGPDGLEDKIVMKGIETVRRDWCDLVGEVLGEVIRIILKEQNPQKAFKYFREVVKKLQNDEIPIEKLVITKGISKRLEDYKGVQPHIELVKKMKKRNGVAPGVGDRVRFVIVKGVQLVSERAEDPDYVIQHGLKIDSRYYIENQLLPPLERVFEAMGINRSELVGYGRQMGLREAIANGKTEKVLKSFDNFICSKCNTFFRRIPLRGKCFCGGDILFYSNGEKARCVLL